MMLRELTKLNRERMKTKRHAHVGGCPKSMGSLKNFNIIGE